MKWKIFSLMCASITSVFAVLNGGAKGGFLNSYYMEYGDPSCHFPGTLPFECGEIGNSVCAILNHPEFADRIYFQDEECTTWYFKFE